MSATRLLVLGVVRTYGKAHGYQVRRELLTWSADRWTNVAPGSIYHALKQMAKEGLLEQVDNEFGGAGPERTGYRLTEDGETEFQRLLASALTTTEPFETAQHSLWAAVTFLTTQPRQRAVSLLRHRITQLEGHRATVKGLLSDGAGWGHPEHVAELYRLSLSYLDATIGWTEDLVKRIEAGEYTMADDGPDHFGACPVAIKLDYPIRLTLVKLEYRGDLNVIEARGLARTFRARGRTVEAVRGVDLHVEAGELVGFLGPNGAGKTTTLRMLTTLLDPTAGEATVAGCDLRTDPVGVRRRIGYVAQGGGTTPELKVIEELVLQGRYYGLSKADSAGRAKDLMARLDIADLDDRLIKTLSGGQRRRLDITLGLIHDPRLVFLDEPSTGLDPQSRANLWDHIRSLRDDHDTTVFLTTHYLDEADALCDRILVIDHGKIVAEGTPSELKSQVSGDGVEVGVPTERIAAAAELAGQLTGAHEVSTMDSTVRFRVPRGDTALPELLRAFDSAGIAMTSIQVHRPTLDDVFLTLTGRTLRDAEAEPAVTAEPDEDKEHANVA